MGKQLDLFGAPLEDENDRINREQAAMRLEQMAREATKPTRQRMRFSKAVVCPSCGSCVTIRL